MDSGSSSQAAFKEQTVALNVLSPSTEEIPSKLTFPNVPISTTIRSLKETIQNAVIARPALPRQRLIYQGKVLTSDEATLKDVFSQEAVSLGEGIMNINKSEPLSLHLVLSPLPESLHRTSSVPPRMSSQSTTNVHRLGTPIVNPSLNQSLNTGGSQQSSHPGAPPHPQQNPGPLPSSLNPQVQAPMQQPVNPNQASATLPPHIQNLINHQLAAVRQQLTAHFVAQGQVPLQPVHAHAQYQSHPIQQFPFHQPSFQQIIAQQQQARAAAGQSGLAQHQPNSEMMREQSRGSPSNVDAPQSSPSNVSTGVRENPGSNGESFQVVFQSTSISRPSSGMGQRPPPQTSNHIPQWYSTPAHNPPLAQPNIIEPNTAAGRNAPTDTSHFPNAANSLAMLHQRLSAIETSLAQGAAPPESVFDHARTYLNNMANQPNVLPPSLEASLRSRLNNLSTQAQNLRINTSNLSLPLPTGQHERQGMRQGISQQPMPSLPMGVSHPHGLPSAPSVATSSTNDQTAPRNSGFTTYERVTPLTPAHASAAPDLYLLSSPEGPHSLLVSPSGTYRTSFTNPMVITGPSPQPQNIFQIPVSQPFSTNQPRNGPTNPAAQPNPHNQPPAPPVPGNNLAQAQVLLQQQQRNQAQDLARILIPLGGHLWLLIRLFGFVYFFTAGGGQRRAILMGICAFIVFIVNTGAFRPFFRSLWEPVRRHIEGLVPLAAARNGRGEGREGQRRQPQQPQAEVDNVAAVQNQHEGGNMPVRGGPLRNNRNSQPPLTPTDLADRLLQERHDQSLLRRAERAIALFLASLVPGVGERHIAARDAAEARRVAEEREREAAAEREREEQAGRERKMEGGEDTGVGSSAVSPAGESSGNDVGGERGGEGVRERPREGVQGASVEI
ncbi:MAG: hypothetical protein Q9219_004936 [cf. Caloplaca sp. 3 TL-2023]